MKGKVIRTERHFYSMPDTCEMFLAALAAIQDYYKWLEKRDVRTEITVHCPNPKLEFLVPAIAKDEQGVIKEVRTDIAGLTVDQFDQAVKFDPDVAYKLSTTTGKHVSQVFGMMIGSDPPKAIPDITMLLPDTKPFKDILVLPFPGWSEVLQFLHNNKPELETNDTDVESECERGDTVFETLCLYKLVVGVRSGLTYLAVAANRAVVEIYPTDCHRDWLSKWSSQWYQMIYGNPGEVSPSLVYRAVEAQWKKVEQRQRAMAVRA